MRSLASRSLLPHVKAPPLFPRSWVANVLRDPEEGKGRSSQMSYGGCWGIVGNLNRMIDRVSTSCSGVCKVVVNPRLDHDGVARGDGLVDF